MISNISAVHMNCSLLEWLCVTLVYLQYTPLVLLSCSNQLKTVWQ